MIQTLRSLKRNIRTRVMPPELERFPAMPYPTVDLVYWRPKANVNFGDELGRTIVELMLAQRGMTVFDEVRKTRRLLTVGSILHHAEDRSVIWGTGRNASALDRSHFFNSLDVRAVRGPRTREFLAQRGIHAPEVFGDPALLMPDLAAGRFDKTGEFEAGLVPNLNDYEEGLSFDQAPIPVVRPTRSWNVVIREILRYRFIVASSLHGLVIAEAFGIPARYVRFTNREGLFKYHDYYEGTGRQLGNIPVSIQEALEMGGKKPPIIDKASLMNSFPYDIWS